MGNYVKEIIIFAAEGVFHFRKIYPEHDKKRKLVGKRSN